MAGHESISETEDVQRPTPGVDLEVNRVSSGYLSCEIPDGWVATANEPTSSHPFTICPEGASAEDGVEIICVRLPPFPDEFHKVGTPDLRLTLMRARCLRWTAPPSYQGLLTTTRLRPTGARVPSRRSLWETTRGSSSTSIKTDRNASFSA